MTDNTKDYYPPMHTAEHILNQTMDRIFACGRAKVHHIERKKSKCDYSFSRALSEDEIKAIELKVNDIINQHLEVSEEFLSPEEAGRKYNISRVPVDETNTIRVVKVGDYDACPCSGLHVKNTSEIGRFYISTCNFTDGILRIRFKLENSSPIYD